MCSLIAHIDNSLSMESYDRKYIKHINNITINVHTAGIALCNADCIQIAQIINKTNIATLLTHDHVVPFFNA